MRGLRCLPRDSRGTISGTREVVIDDDAPLSDGQSQTPSLCSDARPPSSSWRSFGCPNQEWIRSRCPLPAAGGAPRCLPRQQRRVLASRHIGQARWKVRSGARLHLPPSASNADRVNPRRRDPPAWARTTSYVLRAQAPHVITGSWNVSSSAWRALARLGRCVVGRRAGPRSRLPQPVRHRGARRPSGNTPVAAWRNRRTLNTVIHPHRDRLREVGAPESRDEAPLVLRRERRAPGRRPRPAITLDPTNRTGPRPRRRGRGHVGGPWRGAPPLGLR